MEERENYLRTVQFQNPEWIPYRIGIMPATWKKYREKLEEIILKYPLTFPDYKKGSKNFDLIEDPVYRKGEKYKDRWGCVWYNIQEGLEGQIIEHPLQDVENFKNYKAPDPLIYTERGERGNWEEIKKNLLEKNKKGELVKVGTDRFFERLHFLRGFENLMLDFATDAPHLPLLIKMVSDSNIRLINKYLEVGCDIIDVFTFGDDLGSQKQLMVSPKIWKKYLFPEYKKMFQLVRNFGSHTYLHSDGCILEIIDDLIAAGLSIINPQIRPNTLKGLSKFKGKICIDLDLDRQFFPFATSLDIENHIKEAIEVLNLKEGGLMLYAEIEPDVPLENIETIIKTLEKYCKTSV